MYIRCVASGLTSASASVLNEFIELKDLDPFNQLSLIKASLKTVLRNWELNFFTFKFKSLSLSLIKETFGTDIKRKPPHFFNQKCNKGILFFVFSTFGALAVQLLKLNCSPLSSNLECPMVATNIIWCYSEREREREPILAQLFGDI